MDGFADAVEGDAMGGGERLDGGDPGNDLDPVAGAQALDDANGEIVEAGIAPDEKCTGAIVGHMGQQAGEDGGERRMPVIDTGTIVGIGGIAAGHGIVHAAAGGIGDVAGDDVAAQIGEIGLALPLVGNEQQIGAVKRIDGLHRQMLWIAAADAHDQDGFHCPSLPQARQVDKHGRCLYSIK